jgi:hypothetical protein
MRENFLQEDAPTGVIVSKEVRTEFLIIESLEIVYSFFIVLP